MVLCCALTYSEASHLLQSIYMRLTGPAGVAPGTVHEVHVVGQCTVLQCYQAYLLQCYNLPRLSYIASACSYHTA